MSPDRTLYYEDLTYGLRLRTGTRTITEDDLLTFARVSGDHNPLHTDAEYAAGTRFGQRVVHGPLGLAVVLGLLHDLGILERSALALLDARWRFTAPIFVGDTLATEMTVTSRRLARSGESGVVGRHLRLSKQDGTVVQEGQLGLLVRVRDAGAARRADEQAPAPGTPAWGERLAAALGDDPEFAEAARAFDGAIGLRFGDAELALKVFEGRVLRAARRLPTGVTFTVGAAEPVWVDFFGRPRNEFVAMAAGGAFAVHGNVYEYLRLAAALHRLLDLARDLT